MATKISSFNQSGGITAKAVSIDGANSHGPLENGKPASFRFSWSGVSKVLGTLVSIAVLAQMLSNLL